MSTAAARAQVTTPGTATSLVRPTTTSGADYYIPFPFPGPSPFPYPPPVPIPAPSPEPTPPSESTPNDRAPDLTVHAWAAQLNVVDLAQYAILSAAEREVAERFRSAAARWQYIARHCWMRSILAGYLQCRPAEVPLVTGAHGKPSLAGIADLHFNLTRSGARAALVVVRSEALVRVGVDMEPVRQFDRADQIVVGMFTAREERVWRTLAPKDGGARALRFALWWTAKEAWLKAIGLGLQARLDSLDASTLTSFDVQRWCSIRAGVPSNVLHAHAPAAAAQWSLLAFEPFPGYLGTLVLGIEGDPTASDCAIVTDIAANSMGAGTAHGHAEPSCA